VTAPTAEPSTGPPAPAPAPAPAEPRQRWRLTFGREPVAAHQLGRAALDAWQEALVASGLPLAGLEPGGPGRARIAFAAPLPAAAAGEAELAEVWLLERLPLWRVREALADRLPTGHRWIAAEDVWLGSPALAGRVVAADWRLDLGAVASGDLARFAAGARALLDAPELPRTRLKGTTEKRYDLRPLLADLAVAGDPGRPVLRIRTRFEPEAGSGRPDEVVAALAEAAGCEVEVASIARERLILADPVPAPPPPRRPVGPVRSGASSRRR
jgi:radical SAM-linked protein